MATIEEYIENLEQLDDYYAGEYPWDEILENFKLTESFIRTNFDNLDKTLLLQNQDLSLNFLFDYIRYFDIDEVIEIKEITDEGVIEQLKHFKELDKEKIKEESKPIQDKPIVELKKEDIVEFEIKKEDIVEFEIKEDSNATNDYLNNYLSNVDLNEVDSIDVKTKFNVDIEQLSIDRLKSLHVPYNSIVGIYLSKVYITKYKELKIQYENSVKNFDDLILESLNAK